MQRWWIVVVAVVGIGLAILLFPRPDTGDIPAPDPTNTDPLEFRADNTPATPSAVIQRDPPVENVPTNRRPDRVNPGPKPGMERLVELRGRPDAVYAGRLTAPWSSIRYTLMKAKDPDAEDLIEDIGVILAELQVARRDPTRARPFDEMEADLQKLETEVKASKWATDASVVASFTQYHTFLDEYREADAAYQAENDGEGTQPQDDEEAP